MTEPKLIFMESIDAGKRIRSTRRGSFPRGTIAISIVGLSSITSVFAAMILAHNNVVFVLTSDITIDAVSLAALVWAVSFALGFFGVISLIRFGQRSSRRVVIGVVWSLCIVVSGASIGFSYVTSIVGGILYNQIVEVRHSPYSACAVVIRETAAVDETTEYLYVGQSFGVARYDGATELENARPLRSGKILVSWTLRGGTVSYRSATNSTVPITQFACAN